MDIYLVQPPQGFTAILPWVIWAATAVLALVAVWRWARWGWGVACAVAVLVPNTIVLLTSPIDLHLSPDILMDAVLPLALMMGAPPAALGALAGWLLRRKRA